MPLCEPRRWLCRLLLAAACCIPLRAEEDLAAVWRQVTAFFAKEAMWALEALPPTPEAAAQRERDFCHAVILLDLQPLTEARLDEAENRLLRLIAAGEDEIAAAARYLIARSRQLYRQRPDHVAAARLYREVMAHPRGGPWAEMARVKLALLELYVLPAANPHARIAAARSLLAGAGEDFTRRDLHRLIARATLFYDLDPAAAFADLLAAEAIGGLQGEPHADQLVQLTELAWEFGRTAEAARFHARLVAEHPRDVRAWGLAEKLAGRPAPARGRFGHAP